MTHTLEVAQIGRTVARALSWTSWRRSRSDMTSGIRPSATSGSKALKEIYGHFEHNEQSVRIAERLERDGAGLNLTLPVLDGMLNHTAGRSRRTRSKAV